MTRDNQPHPSQPYEHAASPSLLEQLKAVCNGSALLEAPQPALMADPLFSQLSVDQLSAIQLETDSTVLLGKRFEMLLEALLLAHTELELVAKNIVIQGKSRTLGELDFILRHRSENRLIHLEATTKFYIALGNNHFTGPNTRDSLQRRYERLEQHQFPLLWASETQAQLKRLNIGEVEKQMLLSRGRIFYPLDGMIKHNPLLTTGHLRGYWWRSADTPANENWIVLPKSFWLTPEQALVSDLRRISTTNLVQLVEDEHHPQMVIAAHQQSSTGLLPIFVIPDSHWPPA